MKRKMFTLAAFAMAFTFWFFDSTVHYFLYNEPEFELYPTDFNELWMRAVIVILVLLFGIFADFFTSNLMYKDKQLEVARSYNGLFIASQDILNNLLIQMKLFRLEALRNEGFDREVIEFHDKAIKDVTNLINTLSRVDDITEGDFAVSEDPNSISI